MNHQGTVWRDDQSGDHAECRRRHPVTQSIAAMKKNLFTTSCAPVPGIFLRFIREDGGQDLIEYALLGAFIGVCAVTAWINIPPKIKLAYGNWDSNVQSLSSCTKDPVVAGGGGC